MYLRAAACLLALALAHAHASAICPKSCVCSTTRDGLHRAVCSNVSELYKFTIQQRHHNINILDLSHNNITSLTYELDRLTEVVTMDLSTNGITELNKFLHNAKKLVHLNLANNRFKKISLSMLPTSVSSLDLTNNLLRDVPSDIGHLGSLEHLELEGNPLDCSCENLMSRDQLILAKVLIDDVKCASPQKLIDQSWLKIKTKDICKTLKSAHNDPHDMMMGDSPYAEQIGSQTTALKSMSLVAASDLEDGAIIQGDSQADVDNKDEFLSVNQNTPSPSGIEGSGEASGDGEIFAVTKSLSEGDDTTEITEDGTESPEGSGYGSIFLNSDVKSIETTMSPFAFFTGPVTPLIIDDIKDEFPTVASPNIYEGGRDWHSREFIPEEATSTIAPVNENVEIVSEKVSPISAVQDTTVSEPIRVTQAVVIDQQPSSVDEKQETHKTGTYVCIAIIIVLLVGLIGFAILKGQLRRRRDRSLLRQQKRDVEKASKEMIDMNKSLLGKPAVLEAPAEKKQNGKYELVPTHEAHQKKGENGNLSNGNGIKHNGENSTRTDSPRDTNQNKSSSKDNNLIDEIQSSPSQHETSFDSRPTSDPKKDTHSLSSEDIFVPLNDDDSPKINDLDSQPLMNVDQSFNDFLSPSQEYVPVYSPDMGRVRIKLSETPKPKTPTLVTRSRSNAGDIIITPTLDNNARNSAT